MAGRFPSIEDITNVIDTVTGVATYFQDGEKNGVPPLNVEGIRNDLNKAVRKLGSVRTDFENEVKKNKTRVRSRTYVEWLQRVKETKDEVRDLIERYGNQSNEGRWFRFYSSGRDFGEDMKRMHEKVIDLCQESENIRDKMLVDRAPGTIVKMKAPDIRKYKTLQEPVEEILKWLKICKVKRIGIYGIVGIGKTTIMKNLNNHDEVAEMFDIVIWLKVSKEDSKENRNQKDLQRDIANRLKLAMTRTSNAKEVAQRIYAELEGKKYLLLLDNVKEDLYLPEIGIPDSNNGSKIVLTTRQRLVSNSMAADKEIKAAYLSPDEAWKMFKDVLGDEDSIEDPKIARLALKVCRECGGLPLLIEKVASTFKLKKYEILWRDGWNCWMMWPRKECEGIREIYELLRFCYNDLEDERYQKCFLYGALYPEDSDINICSLLECWEAEDLLVHENDVRKKRIMAGVLILNHLKNVSLIEESKRDYVTMNQFIRQAALYISGKDHPECKLLVTSTKLGEPADEISWVDKNRISLGASELDKLPDSPNCSMLSTLFLQANKGLEIIPPAFFNHMKKLRVLDLSDTGIKSLPSSPQILRKLKVLHLNNCKQLMELPSRINGIKDLEFLDIHGSGIYGIPSGIKKLKLLKHLWVSFGNGLSFNYNMVSELSELEELFIDFEKLEQWTNEVVENIMKEVAKLKKFKKLRVCFPEMIVDVIEVAPNTVLINVPEAKTLLSYIQGSLWKEVRKITSFQFFIGLENGGYCQHPNFACCKKYVKYCNGVVSNNPDPILKVLAEAEGFELVNHKDVKQLSDFVTATLNKIQGFLIDSCDAIETILDTMGSKLLPNLEELFIQNLPVLKSIWKGPLQPESLTKLTKLVVFNCQDLVKVFPPGVIKNLHQIQYLKFETCHGVKEIIPAVDAIVEEIIPEDFFDAMDEEIIPEVDAIENLPELPNLKELILLDMKQLSSISAIESLKCPSLEKLEIFKCPDLHKLPFNKDNVKNLKCIEVEKEWWEELQLQNQEDKELLKKLCSFEVLFHL
ncbi:hypothetical protein Vadar_019124 [Vaccinium darrowii]|uniref:Uncharacterized protein n=1 Tax=Vaccinium darrowii TaxID=229202 RepID=A0ACB7X239_9ERIC|nr:hypothetical protein Vadar_019124 [Vaccinium darrowii]